MKKSVIYIFILIVFSLLSFLTSCSDERHTYYEITDNAVIYHYVEHKAINFFTASYHEKVVRDVDLATFSIMTKKYAKDKNHIYFEGMNVGLRDVKSFKILEHSLSKDKLGAYYLNTKIEGSHGPSFKVLNYYYYKDNSNIYSLNNSNIYTLDSIDYKTFKVVQETYAKDKQFVLYKGNILNGMSSKDFKILTNHYSIDPLHVFYEDVELEADAKFFEVLQYGYAKDDKNIFYEDVNLNADYSSFKIIDRDKNSEIQYFAEDKYFYYSGITVTKK